MFKLLVTSVFMSLALSEPVMEKISSNVIRQGDKLWTFYYPGPGYDTPVAHRVIGSPSGKAYSSIKYGSPIWAHGYMDVDSTPDVNILANGSLVLYFKSLIAYDRVPAIGAAFADSLREEDGIFYPAPFPIIRPNNSETISNPALQQLADGTLRLFYTNYTVTNIHGTGVQSVKLTADGMNIAT